MRSKRTLAFLLVLAILLTLFPASVFAAEAEQESNAEETRAEQKEEQTERLHPMLDEQTAREKGHIQRLSDEEGDHLNQLIFRNQDGTKTMYVYDHPVKYRDEQGNTHDISLEIADTGDTAYPFRTQANSAVTEFPASLPDGIILSGNGVSLRMAAQLPVSNVALNHRVRRMDDQTVAYTYDAKTTIEYTLTYAGFKEDIVVSEYTGQTEYPFILYTNGLNLANIDGGYYLTDGAGTIQATIGDIIVFTADERNNTFGTLQVTTIKPGQIYGLTIVLDPDYLSDPNTAYPIRIDPTVELVYTDAAPNVIEEKTIQSNGTTNGSNSTTAVGYSSYGINRSIMKFPGLDFSELEGVTVTSAVATLRDLMCESEELTVTCYPFTGSIWTESTAQWSNLSQSWGDALSSNVISYDSGRQQESAHRYRFDITELAQKWVDGYADPARGIIFRADSSVESGPTIIYKTFATSERSGYRPTFEITYQDKISFDAASIDVDKGSRITLSAYSVLGQEDGLTWTSSAESVASVDEDSGVVTGEALGSAVITASYVDEDGNTISASCTVYVTVPDGVYYIRRTGSTMCLANEDSSVNSVSTHVEAKNTSTATDPTQFWQITHLGTGWYAIRPIDRILAVLTTDNNKNAVVKDLAENATIHISNRWKIIQESTGYVFLHKGLSTNALTATDSTEGANVILASKTTYSNCHWILDDAIGLVLRDTATQRCVTDANIKYIEKGEYIYLADLGLKLERYGHPGPESWMPSNANIAYVDQFGTLYTVGLGQNTITVTAGTDDGSKYSCSYTVICYNTINLDVIYDYGYLAKYPNAVSRINSHLSALQEFYFNEFYIDVVFTAPQVLQSYADTCPNPYNENCDCSDSCKNTSYNENGIQKLENYHHKNYYNIVFRIPFPDTSTSFKMAFTGHNVCSFDHDTNACCRKYGSDQNPILGTSFQIFGLTLIAHDRVQSTEIVTVVHEFGHLLGAPDHYGSGCETTAQMEVKYPGYDFDDDCIYGKDYYDNPDTKTELKICDGCKKLIQETAAQTGHD